MGTITNQLAHGVTTFQAEIPCEAAGPGLPIWNYGSKTPDNRPPVYKTPAYLWITGCACGDMLDVNFTLQVNNETNCPIECSGEFLIKPWDAITNPSPYTYENSKRFSLNVGENVTPDQHHMLVTRRATYIVPPTWIDGTPHPADFYLIARWYAGCDAPEVQGQILTILPYSTDLFAIRHRK